MITFIIMLVITGLIVGALGRLLLPGRDPMSIGQTILVGIGGSLVAGLIGRLLFGGRGGGGHGRAGRGERRDGCRGAHNCRQAGAQRQRVAVAGAPTWRSRERRIR